MQTQSFEEAVEQIVVKHPRYEREAYFFVREALDYTQRMNGIREYTLQQFGPMTLTVLEAWGIKCCEDFGEIVFNMVETRLLAKTDRDSRDDFKNGYDFHEAFRKPYLPSRTISVPMAETKQG